MTNRIDSGRIESGQIMGGRTLAETLRRLDTDQLTELLELRPDLRYPLPRHIDELVAQATTSTSVGRAIERLDGWQLALTEALAVLADGATVSDICALLGRPADPVRAGVDALRRRALLWGADDDLHLARAAREHFGSYPAGLAPASPHPLSKRAIDSALQSCGPHVRPVLDRLLWGPPTGTVRNADRAISIADARTPVEMLLAHRLIRALDRDTVILAQEVALQLRAEQGDWLLDHSPVPDQPPELTGPTRTAAVVRSAGVGAAQELIHDAELMIAELDATPRRLLRDGGLSSRDVQALARAVDGRVDYAGFLLELTSAAGLIGSPDRITVLPTVSSDLWVSEPGADRWRRLARAWRDTERYFSADTTPHPLATDAVAARAPQNRRLLLDLLSSVKPATVITIGDLAASARWHRPSIARHSHQFDDIIAWTWQEATWLGLLALDAVTELLPVVATDAELSLPIRRLFPEPLDHVIIQSDLTAVAQGPLEPGVAHTLRLLADQESRGGGAVYRFGQTSVRRAFDAGWAAVEITDWLEHHSLTGVPQPLRYLVDDVARQHGTIRVGGAGSYLRVEDPAQQAAILAHPSAVRLQLRQIAPGVLISPADPDEVVTALQDIGLKPAAEDADGHLLTTQPRRRAPARTPRSDQPATLTAREAAAAVLAAERRLPPARTSQDLELLADAVRTERALELTIVGADGTAHVRTLQPLAVADGSVRAVDPKSAEIVSVPLARIAACALAAI